MLKSEATSSCQKFEDSWTALDSNSTDMINSSLRCGLLSNVPAPLCGVRWRKVVSLNMKDPSQQCPSPWVESSTPNRSCYAQYNDICVGVSFPVSGVAYSRVHGQAVGYGLGTPDAFYNRFGRNNRSIDAAYLYGMSITHGSAHLEFWNWTWCLSLPLLQYRSHIFSLTPCLCWG